MAALYGFESRHRHHSEMTFVCQMPAQARSSRQQRSFFVQTRDRFAGSRICFWGWENFVCWSDSNRTVALKNGLLRHRSAQSAARFDGKSHFFVQPRNCSAGLRVCFWGRAVFAYRPDVDRERWMANKRTDVLVFGVLDKTAGNNI